MLRTSILKYLNPWKYKREAEQARLAELRARDGDDCRRCRRPMRFDLPRGHDLGPAIEQVVATSTGGSEEAANLCLCHRRCNRAMTDATSEVTKRMRMKNEAELLSRSRKRKTAA
jgi:5-methylcytosine-specific restriction endonuclease McrA